MPLREETRTDAARLPPSRIDLRHGPRLIPRPCTSPTPSASTPRRSPPGSGTSSLTQGSRWIPTPGVSAVRLSRKTSDIFDTLIQQQQSKWGNKTGPLLSGISYCIASCSMILLNKVVLSSYNFNAAVSLMLYQNLISVVILLALEQFSVISTEQLTWKLIEAWIPVNFIFVAMLVTGITALASFLGEEEPVMKEATDEGADQNRFPPMYTTRAVERNKNRR